MTVGLVESVIRQRTLADTLIIDDGGGVQRVSTFTMSDSLSLLDLDQFQLIVATRIFVRVLDDHLGMDN